jgi:hypothetical protein
MQKLKTLFQAGAAAAAVAIVSAPAHAALDVSGAVDELTAAGTAATTLIGAAIVFAGICMAGFALYRRIK